MNNRKPKILAFAGSLRKDSFNKKILKIAVEGARSAGADVTHVDLRDFFMPIYDGDLEAASGLPENAKKFKKMMIESDGFLIAAPEYNSSISGVIKNTIDWASRPETPDEEPLIAFKGKTAALLSASPSFLGGLRGLYQLRWILTNIFVLVLPEQFTLSKAHEAFDEKGELKDATKKEHAGKMGELLTTTLNKFL